MAKQTASAGIERERGPEKALLDLSSELAEGRIAALEALHDALAADVHLARLATLALEQPFTDAELEMLEAMGRPE